MTDVRLPTSLGLCLLLAAGVAFATEAPAPQTVRFVVSSAGMDCAGCNVKVTKALTALDFVTTVNASFVTQNACAEGSGTVDEEAVKGAITGLGYTFGGLEMVDECPAGLRGKLPAPWATRGTDLDVVTISHGEEVDIGANLAADKYTIVDFGAPWCGPCHEAADQLVVYMQGHPDVAVRAVDLDAQTADASYVMPVVEQHLKYVDGIPWLIVYAPNGKVLAKDRSVERVVAAIDKHRARLAKKKKR